MTTYLGTGPWVHDAVDAGETTGTGSCESPVQTRPLLKAHSSGELLRRRGTLGRTRVPRRWITTRRDRVRRLLRSRVTSPGHALRG